MDHYCASPDSGLVLSWITYVSLESPRRRITMDHCASPDSGLFLSLITYVSLESPRRCGCRKISWITIVPVRTLAWFCLGSKNRFSLL